jgi:hypothetical protein
MRHQKHWGSQVIAKNTVSLQLLSSTAGRFFNTWWSEQDGCHGLE